MERVGLEAISRGAKKAIMCDNSKKAVNTIRKNIEKTHMEEKVEIYQLDFKELLKTKIKEKIDIVFLDPPYESNFAYQAVKLIMENDLTDDDSIMIIETDQEERDRKSVV